MHSKQPDEAAPKTSLCRRCKQLEQSKLCGANMVFRLMLASLVGGLATLVGLWSQGALVAFLCAPLGGSALTLIVALAAALRTEDGHPPPYPDRSLRVPNVAARVPQRV